MGGLFENISEIFADSAFFSDRGSVLTFGRNFLRENV